MDISNRNLIKPANVQGEAVPGGVKQKNMAGEGRNRRALGDIGNLVTARRAGAEVKPIPQITRPVTRSFCAQLLANAQVAAENKKVNVVKGERKPKPPQKKVTVKPKPEPVAEVIEISPDTIEGHDAVTKKLEGSSKKKTQTSLTSTLTARSKAACGLSKKPIVDIDAADLENELAVVEYVEDMYKFYKLAESESRVHDYMDSQPAINERMRAILIDWLIEVHHKFELMPETLYLTINIVDRFLARKAAVQRKELQLVGISAMLMASKYEEIWAPEVNDFVCISDRAYTHQQVLLMEKRILGELGWTLTVPTPYVFLVRFLKAAAALPDHDSDMENMVYFLAELGIMNYETITYCPSMIAASAVYAARCTLNKSPVWNQTLKLHTGFSELQLMDCAKLLVGFHLMVGDGESKLKVIHSKYSNQQRGAVALLPPAKALMAAK